MKRNWFLLKDFLSSKILKRISGIFSLALFSLSVMSFTNNDGSAKKNKKTPANDSLNSKGFKNLFSTDNSSTSSNIIIGLNQKVVDFVKDFVRRQSDNYNSMKDWGRPYFDLFDQVLSSNDIPVQLKYLAVIESDLQKNLVSSAGAVGPWQLMPDEAKRYKIGSEGRTNFYKSTQAASKLLQALYNEYGNWLLVVGAYNCGCGRMNQAIKKAGTDDFWQLQYYLPQETRNHVKKFIAAHYFFEGSGSIATMSTEETKAYKELLAAKNNAMNLTKADLDSTSTVDVSGKYNSAIIEKDLGIEAEVFNRFNPAFDKVIADGSTYHLRLPLNKISLFQNLKSQILQESVQQLFASPAMLPKTIK
ncbi:MAG: lytic transglycosylase domain-containing protein [Chitinophagaceae bacterium]